LTLLSGTGHRTGVRSISLSFYHYRISVNLYFLFLEKKIFGNAFFLEKKEYKYIFTML